ncbi:unnamed protein product, partial [Ectocarpus sp. 8 AP-2014]
TKKKNTTYTTFVFPSRERPASPGLSRSDREETQEGGNKHSGGTRAHPQHKKSAAGEKGYTRERSRHQRSRHPWEFQHILLLPWPVRDLPTNKRFATFARSALCRDQLAVEIMVALKVAGGGELQRKLS